MKFFKVVICFTFLIVPRLAASQSSSREGQYIVKYKNIGKTARSYINTNLNTKRFESINNLELIEVKSEPDKEYLKSLKSNDIIEYIEPNYTFQVLTNPNDEKFAELWGLNNTAQDGGTSNIDIDANEAWELTSGSEEVVVGVIDSGINYNHPDLKNNIWINTLEIPENGIDDDQNGVIDDIHGYNAIDSSGNPDDDFFHGSHCAGIIAASGNNNIGVIGVSWKIKLMAIRIIDKNNNGSVSDAIKGIEYAVMMKKRGINIRILNNSWGNLPYSRALEEAVELAEREGILFVVAAGNSNKDTDLEPVYPSNYKKTNVINVAALDRNGNKASFSNYGETSVDIAAPGHQILSTGLGESYIYQSGTSMAAPHVSGIAALLLSREPNLSVISLKNRLLLGRKDLPQLRYQMRAPGIISAQRALSNQLIPIPEVPTSKKYIKRLSNSEYDNNLGNLLSKMDDGYFKVNLPFNFEYFGQSLNSIAISTNGRAIPLLANQEIPKNSDYTNSISSGMLVYHHDLQASKYSNGGVFYKLSSNKAIFTWISTLYKNRFNNNPVDEIRFQLQISSNGKISYHYQDIDTSDPSLNFGAKSSIGLARITGTFGEPLIVTNNSANPQEVKSSKAIHFDIIKSYSDFDSDGISDLVVLRPNTFEWFISESKENYSNLKKYQLGLPGDHAILADYDGDSLADISVWRPKNGYWYISLSSTNYKFVKSIQWGKKGDRPLTGDYDGDGKSDITVYRPSSKQFLTLKSSYNFNRNAALKKNKLALATVTLGGNSAEAIVGRFTNAYQDEYATVLKSNRFWSVKNINNKLLFSLPWGNPGDLAFAADIDGDKLSDRVVARKVGASWRWFTSFAAGGSRVDTFGESIDIPNCSRDFDGDGKIDLATYKNATGMWNIKLSSSGKISKYQFGLPGDKQP